MDNFEKQRKQLAQYLCDTAIKSPAIKEAFLLVKREHFLPAHFAQHSYADEAVRIGSWQTISQPTTIAHMLELLDLKKGMKVLEVGSGSGYMIALLSHIAGKDGKIYGIEFLPELKEKAEKNLKKEKISNYELKKGDGSQGWKENAPFERIIVSCACPFIPKSLFDQLLEGGKIVAPEIGRAHV